MDIRAARDSKPIDDAAMSAIMAAVQRQRWWHIAIVCLAIAGGLFIALTSPKMYRAEVLMVPAADDSGQLLATAGRLASLAGLGGILPGSGSGKADEAIATLESGEFTRSFITDRKLLPILFRDDWDSQSHTWRGKPPRDAPTLGDAVRRFAKLRRVEKDARNGLITLSIDWRDPALAADWANDLVRRLNEDMRTRAITEAKQSLEFLQRELDRTQTVKARDAMYSLIEANLNKITLATVRPEYAVRVIDRAVPPDPTQRVAPHRVLILAMALVAGLATSAAVIAIYVVLRYLGEHWRLARRINNDQ
jgi:uncharacterized protein involved in exopolysaccharide biosynthesis